MIHQMLSEEKRTVKKGHTVPALGNSKSPGEETDTEQIITQGNKEFIVILKLLARSTECSKNILQEELQGYLGGEEKKSALNKRHLGRKDEYSLSRWTELGRENGVSLAIRDRKKTGEFHCDKKKAQVPKEEGWSQKVAGNEVEGGDGVQIINHRLYQSFELINSLRLFKPLWVEFSAA